MKPAALAVIVVLMQFVSGCSVLPAKSPSTARVSEVIDKVKDDLRQFADSPVLLMQNASQGAVCKSADGKNVVQIVPESIKLTLKTVAATENDPGIALVAPLGVFSIDPAYSGAYTRSKAQSLEIDLDAVTMKPREATRPIFANQVKGADANDHPLFSTIVRMGNELLAVDHTKLPCVKPTFVKSVIYFDVVNKTFGGISIQVLGFKFGDKVTVSDEFHQILEVGFNLKGSSEQFMQQIR